MVLCWMTLKFLENHNFLHPEWNSDVKESPFLGVFFVRPKLANLLPELLIVGVVSDTSVVNWFFTPRCQHFFVELIIGLLGPTIVLGGVEDRPNKKILIVYLDVEYFEVKSPMGKVVLWKWHFIRHLRHFDHPRFLSRKQEPRYKIAFSFIRTRQKQK